MPTIRTVVKNYSRYPIQNVWENAQDLEHVAYLHSQTNKAFELLLTHKSSDSPWVYDVMSFRCVRKTPIGSIQSFGVRRIQSKFNLWQVELIPLLGIKSTLNSILYETQDPDYPTLMLDEVVMEIPFWLTPMTRWIIKSIHRHAKIQCQEDEPFRKRRQELAEHGIKLPFSIFHLSHFEKIGEQFQHSPSKRPE